MSNFEVWDRRECVSHHSTAMDAHRTIKQSLEQIDGVDGTAFPVATP